MREQPLSPQDEEAHYMKLLAILFALVAAIVWAGVSGAAFYVWPTGFGDHSLKVTPAVLAQLNAMKREHKFAPDFIFYQGALNEAQRVLAQRATDDAIQTVIDDLPAHPSRAAVLGHLKLTLARFPITESEERDRLLFYLGRVLDVCGIDSSGELFNVWRYGFPYGWFLG
jgi:hypothetical protein